MNTTAHILLYMKVGTSFVLVGPGKATKGHAIFIYTRTLDSHCLNSLRGIPSPLSHWRCLKFLFPKSALSLPFCESFACFCAHCEMQILSSVVISIIYYTCVLLFVVSWPVSTCLLGLWFRGRFTNKSKSRDKSSYLLLVRYVFRGGPFPMHICLS